MNAENCIVIVDGYSTGRHLAPRFRQLGYRVVHLQAEREINVFDVEAFQRLDYDDNVIFEGDLKAVVERIRLHNPSAVIAGSESGVILTDFLANALGLPGNVMALAGARRNKQLMQDALASAGVPGPRTLSVVSTKDINGAVASLNHRYPLIVKPKDSAGSDGVHICHSIDEVHRAADSLLGKVNAMNSLNDVVLVQEMLEGPQYIVNTISVDGNHFVSEIWLDVRQRVAHGIAYCYEQLLELNGELQSTLGNYALSVLQALGVREGPAHHEIVMTDQGPRLIEVGCRMQGSINPHVIEEALGYSHVSLSVDAIHSPVNMQTVFTSKREKLAVRCVSLISLQSGMVKALRNIDKIRALESFKLIHSMIEAGDQLSETVDMASSPGVIYLMHPDRLQLENDYQVIRRIEANEGFFEVL